MGVGVERISKRLLSASNYYHIMDKDDYKKLMLETNKGVGKIVLGYLKPLKKENRELFDICSELLKKKIGTFETREYLMRMCFEICSGSKWTEEIKHACASVELELVSMYYTNRIFDEKRRGGSIEPTK